MHISPATLIGVQKKPAVAQDSMFTHMVHLIDWACWKDAHVTENQGG